MAGTEWVIDHKILCVPKPETTIISRARWMLMLFFVNSNKSPTTCNNFAVYYPDVYLQLNMFRAFYRSSSGAQWLQWQPLVGRENAQNTLSCK
jgi:hypothetical protein